MNLLQSQNFETINLNKRMISKFNTQLENIKQNERILRNQIIEIRNAIENNND